MSAETSNPNGDPITQPDPLLDAGSFIDPTEPTPIKSESTEPEPTESGDPVVPEQEDAPGFDPNSVIAAKPLTVVPPGETVPTPTPKRKRMDAEEMSKRPPWLPEDWKMDVKVRTSGSTAGLVDRYYFEPKNGTRFRSKVEVMAFLETGTTGTTSKSKKLNSKSKSKAPAATTSSSKKSKRKSKPDAGTDAAGTDAAGADAEETGADAVEAGAEGADAKPSGGSPVSPKLKKSSAKRNKSEAA